MADVVDAAQAYEDAQRKAAIERALRPPSGTGRADCIDCDHPIPEDRRRAMPNASRCVQCQGAFERQFARR